MPEVVVEKKDEIIPSSEFEKQILKNFTSGDQTLNKHIFGYIPMKVVELKKQKYYEMLSIKKPDGKR